MKVLYFFNVYASKQALTRSTAIIALILLLHPLSVYSQAMQGSYRGLPLTTSFTTEDYHGGIQNWDIAQDQYGLIHVANNFGLLTFDGEEWQNTDIARSTRVRALLVDANQEIYIGGQGDFGFLSPSDSGRSVFTSLKPLIPEKYLNFDEIWKIYEQGNTKFFCSLHYIFKYENGKLEVIDPQQPIGFASQVNDQLYIKHSKYGLSLLQGDELKPIEGAEAFKDMEVRNIIPYSKDCLIVATAYHGLFLFEKGKASPWDIPVNHLLIEGQINEMKRLSNHQLAIGTQNSGLFIIDHDGQLVHALNKNRGLPNQTILCFLQDRLGNLWVGLNNGIAYIELGQPFTVIGDEIDLPGTGYTAGERGNQLYLGTSNGLFYYKPANPIEGQLSGYSLVAQTAGQTYGLNEIGGSLMLGHHNGPYAIEGEEGALLPNHFNGAWKFLLVEENKALAGAYDGMYQLLKQDGQWTVKKKYSKFGESSRKFEIDPNGNIWMSHGYKGVYRLTFDESYDSLLSVRHYTAADGLPGNLLINVFKVAGHLCYATPNSVFRYDQDADRFIPDETLFPFFEGQHVRELEEDLLGNIYFLTKDNLGVLKKNQFGEYRKDTSRFQKVISMVSDDLENITVVGPNNVLINAKSGFIHFDPTVQERPLTPYPTLIRKITRGDQPVFLGHYQQEQYEHNALITETLWNDYDYGKTSIKIQFSAPFFEALHAIEYQYYLEGYETAWSDWNSSSEKEYTNLMEGRYTFHVRSRNIYGELGETASFTFRVRPPWFRSSIAYTCYFLLAFLGIGMLWFWIDGQYRKKQESLEASTQEAIEQKDVQLKEVTEQSEKTITQLKNEKLNLEIDAKNRELAASAMHLIHKNEFLSHLKNSVGQLSKDSKNASVTKGLNKLVKEIERNIAEDETWQQFEMHFDQVHGDFTQKLKQKYPKLTPQELRLSAFLRMNMSTKEIAHLLNISVRGVEISRYRLRKKLDITRETNLVEFMMDI